MDSSSNRSLRLLDVCLLAGGTALAIYVYAGFFHPDSYMLSYGANPRKILWCLQIGIPAAYCGAVLLYINARLGKIDPRAVMLMSVTTLIGLYIAYTVADVFYQRWFDRHRTEYHPYLQLTPREYKPSLEAGVDAITVFCMGGSTTELPDNSGVDWPSRVEKILRTSYGMQNVHVHNLGRQWYTSLHTLINYETNLRKHRPSILLYMGAVNDLLQNADFSYFSRGPFREDYGHFYGPVNRIIDRRSLWRYLCDVVGGIWYAHPRRVITTETFPGLAAYRRNVRTLIELAVHDSTRVVLMTEPYLFKPEMPEEERSAIGMLRAEAINDSLVWSSQTALNGMEQYNGALKALAEQNNLSLIDLEREVPKSLTYFRDEVHYRDTTYSIVASFVAKKLQEILSEHAAVPAR